MLHRMPQAFLILTMFLSVVYVFKVRNFKKINFEKKKKNKFKILQFFSEYHPGGAV